VNGRKTFACFFIGIFLVQAAWIAAMPAFRGPDEFDHVYRAEGVSHGAFMPGGSIPSARGDLTPVRRSVIDAASKVCASYKYTGYYNCHAYGPDSGDWGKVASGAGRYNPAYYFVVGNVARFFEGQSVNYVIRMLTAAMCAGMLAWAATLWTRLGRSRWRTLAFMSALTPVLLFSTAIAAPNGVSYAAAVLLWVAGLLILSDPSTRRPGNAIVGVAVGAVVMSNTHTTGPLWLLLIATTWLLLKPASVLQVLRDRRYWGLIAVVGLGVVASVLWTLASGASAPDITGDITSGPEVGALTMNELAWLLQTIAAFPLRNEMAPPAVYVLWLVGFVLLMVRVIKARGRSLLAVLWIAIAMIATQTILTFVSFKIDGYAWQGRYGLPFTVGLALLAGFSDSGRSKPLAPVYDSAIVGIPIATGLSVWHVAHNEHLFMVRPWTDFLIAGPVTAGIATALGTALMIWTLANSSPAHNHPMGSDQAREPLNEPQTEEAVR
jgi:hypothetical protein